MKSIRATVETSAVFALLAPAMVWAEIEGTKAEGIRGLEICIVANSYTEIDFRDAYERRIRAKGYTTRSVAEKGMCPITGMRAAGSLSITEILTTILPVGIWSIRPIVASSHRPSRTEEKP